MCRPRSTPTNSRVNLPKVGRCRSVGCQPHGCGCQAYRDVLAASPHSDTAPPTHGMPAFAFAFAVEVAGQRPALPGVQGAALPKNTHKKQQAEACCFGVMVRPERFELPTAWFVARYSIQLSYGRQLHKLVVLTVYGAPGEIRTPDRLVRSQVLYPTELRARGTQSTYCLILLHFQRRMLKTCRVVRPERFELPTAWFVARYSIQLSYGRPATGAELCGCRRVPSTVL